MKAQLINTFRAHADQINTVVILAEKHWIVTGSDDGLLKVWQLYQDDPLHIMQGDQHAICRIAAFPDVPFIVAGNQVGTLHVWNAGTGEPIRTMSEHEDAITALTVTRDGQHIISGSADGTLRVWDSTSGALRQTMTDFTHEIVAITTSPDDSAIVVGENNPQQAPHRLSVWSLSAGQLLREFDDIHHGVNFVRFASNGKQVITGATEGDITVWDWESGSILRLIETHQGSAVTTLMPNTRYAVVGTQRPMLSIWSVENGRHVHTLDEPSAWVSSISVTDDGRHIIAGCHDGMLNVYQLMQN